MAGGHAQLLVQGQRQAVFKMRRFRQRLFNDQSYDTCNYVNTGVNKENTRTAGRFCRPSVLVAEEAESLGLAGGLPGSSSCSSSVLTVAVIYIYICILTGAAC